MRTMVDTRALALLVDLNGDRVLHAAAVLLALAAGAWAGGLGGP